MVEWHVTAELSSQGDLHLEGALMEGSPVDLLIAAVAACFVKSCQIVQGARTERPSRVVANVIATKADNSPNRVEQVRIAWSMPDLEKYHAAKIARDAKRICTVTNSMSCEFEVVAS
jgi:uncharacterized OsmC-like protein